MIYLYLYARKKKVSQKLHMSLKSFIVLLELDLCLLYRRPKEIWIVVCPEEKPNTNLFYSLKSEVFVNREQKCSIKMQGD